MVRNLLKAVIIGGTLSLSPLAGAEVYPDKIVRIIVPYPAGGGVDFVGRTIAQRLGIIWGQTVTIENKSGASGTIGADYVAKSKSDGYTLLLASPAEVMVGPIAGQKTPYDPVKSFTPVILVGETPLGIVAHPSVPGKILAETLAVAKKDNLELAYGTPGAGSSMQFAGEALNQLTGIQLKHVPYRGAAPAVNDILGNQVPIGIVGLPPVVAHVNSGKMKLLAVTTSKRSTAFPDVPAVSELPGLKDYRFSNWMLLFAPIDTPSDIVKKIAGDLTKILKEPETQKRLEDAGVDPMGLSGTALATFMSEERTRYSKIAKERNIRFNE